MERLVYAWYRGRTEEISMGNIHQVSAYSLMEDIQTRNLTKHYIVINAMRREVLGAIGTLGNTLHRL